MFTGWSRKHYPLNRPLTDEEKIERLRLHTPDRIPYPGLNVLRANGTFIECAERSQGMRGSFIVLFFTVCVFGMCIAAGYGLLYDSLAGAIAAYHSPEKEIQWGGVLVAWIGGGIIIGLSWLLLPMLRYNFFSYTYFPRRFNRKNRQVYVFNRDGSVSKLPFDDIYWHIGHGVHKELIDLRGHQLDQDSNVIFTFSCSLFHQEEVQRERIPEWFSFLCAYMDKGLNGVAENDWDRIIGFKYGANWQSCKVELINRYRQLYPLFFWFIPVHTAFYWLSMKLSKEPQWPQWVEDECVIDPNDPPPWPEPSYSGEFDLQAREPAYYEHLADRMRLPEDSPQRKALIEEGKQRRKKAQRKVSGK